MRCVQEIVRERRSETPTDLGRELHALVHAVKPILDKLENDLATRRWALGTRRLLEDAVAMTATETLTLGEAGRIAEPFLADPANEAHLVRLLNELRRIESDARTAGRW
jgi:hypothetical protein